jgi:hypothetical protein
VKRTPKEDYSFDRASAVVSLKSAPSIAGTGRTKINDEGWRMRPFLAFIGYSAMVRAIPTPALPTIFSHKSAN